MWIIGAVFGIASAVIIHPIAASAQALIPLPRVPSYEELARQPDAHKGRFVSFIGEVIQTEESGNSVVLRVNVKRGKYDIWTDMIYVDYRKKNDTEPRILEKDIVEFSGQFAGIKSCTAPFGQTVQIPHVIAERITKMWVLLAPIWGPRPAWSAGGS